MAVAVSLTLEQLAAELERQAEQGRAFLNSTAANATKKKLSLLLVAGVKDNFARGQGPDGSPWPAPRIRGGKPLLDTGRMRNTTSSVVTATGVEVHNNSVQARLHNEGGTIRAKGKFLAIPLTPAARRVTSPRQIPGLHFMGKKGASKGVLVDKKGKAIFALVPSVTIPRREFMGFTEATLTKADTLIMTDLAKFVGGST